VQVSLQKLLWFMMRDGVINSCFEEQYQLLQGEHEMLLLDVA
jgi:hypothetical protein